MYPGKQLTDFFMICVLQLPLCDYCVCKVKVKASRLHAFLAWLQIFGTDARNGEEGGQARECTARQFLYCM